MHLTAELARKYTRLPMRPIELKKVPFREVRPLQLKNAITATKEKAADVSCLQEMAVMFACMKKNDFREIKCSEEIHSFNKCYTELTERKAVRKQREESGEMIAGANVRNLTTKQKNQLLAKYPQFNEKL